MSSISRTGVIGCFGDRRRVDRGRDRRRARLSAPRGRHVGGGVLRRRRGQPGVLPRVPQLRRCSDGCRLSSCARTTSTASSRPCLRDRRGTDRTSAERIRHPGVEVDGNESSRSAPRPRGDRRARAAAAALLECHTYRHKGHSRHDDPRRYRPDEELEGWLVRDPLTLAERRSSRARQRDESADRAEPIAALAEAKAPRCPTGAADRRRRSRVGK